MLDERPVMVRVDARHAKNRRSARVPIPADLAAALRMHAARMMPEARVFATMPQSRGRIVEVLARDLAGAGIEQTRDERVDFHSFRATAITWWFTAYGLTVREVSELARCLPRTAERYARNYRPERFEWLSRGPGLAADTHNGPSAELA
jgi:integrase